MSGVGVQPRVPEQGDGDFGDGNRQGEAEQAGAQIAGMALGNGGDEVGGPGERQSGREAADDRGDLPFKPDRFESVVDGTPVDARRGDQDVPPARISGGIDFASAERMPDPNDSDEAVAEQPLRPHFGTRHAADHSGLEVDAAIAQRSAVPVGLGHEA
jgi:hypothetical protein